MSNYKTFYENTIVDNIDLESYGLSNDIYLYDKIKTTYNIFKKEHGFMIERVGEVNAFKEWLQGLPSVLTVPFYNHDILENARKEYLLKSEEKDWFKDKEEQKFLDNYWTRLSLAFFNLKDNL